MLCQHLVSIPFRSHLQKNKWDCTCNKGLMALLNKHKNIKMGSIPAMCENPDISKGTRIDQSCGKGRENVCIMISRLMFTCLYQRTSPYSRILWLIGSINHAGCWKNTRRDCKARAEGELFTSFKRVFPTSQVVYCTDKSQKRKYFKRFRICHGPFISVFIFVF